MCWRRSTAVYGQNCPSCWNIYVGMARDGRLPCARGTGTFFSNLKPFKKGLCLLVSDTWCLPVAMVSWRIRWTCCIWTLLYLNEHFAITASLLIFHTDEFTDADLHELEQRHKRCRHMAASCSWWTYHPRRSILAITLVSRGQNTPKDWFSYPINIQWVIYIPSHDDAMVVCVEIIWVLEKRLVLQLQCTNICHA